MKVCVRCLQGALETELALAEQQGLAQRGVVGVSRKLYGPGGLDQSFSGPKHVNTRPATGFEGGVVRRAPLSVAGSSAEARKVKSPIQTVARARVSFERARGEEIAPAPRMPTVFGASADLGLFARPLALSRSSFEFDQPVEVTLVSFRYGQSAHHRVSKRVAALGQCKAHDWVARGASSTPANETGVLERVLILLPQAIPVGVPMRLRLVSSSACLDHL